MLKQHEFRGIAEAKKAIQANVSPRYIRLDNHQAWAKGAQYDHLQSWWDDTNDTPLWERKPCVIYPVVEIAARSNVDLVFGEGRFPVFSAAPGENEDEDDNGLGDDDSAALDRFIREYHRLSRFRVHCRESFHDGQVVGSVAAVHGARNGRPFVDSIPAKWCEPKLGIDGEVVELDIRYPYTEQFKDRDGKWAVRPKLYRRLITAERDIEYFPADAREDGTEPLWQENPDRSVQHGFGFCPVVWYPFMKGTTTINVIDGHPIHEELKEEIRQHDIARSQWHRGALLSEPQLCEFGVRPGYNPTDTGRPARIPASEKGGESAEGLMADGKLVVDWYVDPAKENRGARKKGPGWVWQYADKESRVEAVAYPAASLEAQENNVRDLRIKLQESLCVVFLDPENIKFAATTSGKALQAIKQKQIDRCDQFRDDLAENFLEPSIAMQLRIAQRLLSSGKRLRVPGADKVRGALDKIFDSAVGQQLPALEIKWGNYFKPDPTEQKQIVELVKAAVKDSPLITLRIAVERIAPIFGIENVDAVVEELESAVTAGSNNADPVGTEPNDDPDDVPPDPDEDD